MSRTVKWTTQFKEDYKQAMKRNLNMNLIDNIIRDLADGKELILILTLARTGTHSDLFGK